MLAECYEIGNDNFLLLRFVAATMVIFGHAYALSGIPGAADFIARANLGNGIYSGSLAVKSRALRVLPADAACMLFSAFVLGAVYIELSPTRPLLIFVFSLPLTLLCAMFSWHFVERVALNLKKKALAQQR